MNPFTFTVAFTVESKNLKSAIGKLKKVLWLPRNHYDTAKVQSSVFIAGAAVSQRFLDPLEFLGRDPQVTVVTGDRRALADQLRKLARQIESEDRNDPRPS